MNGTLQRRLIALERVPGVSGVVYRVYSSDAEADADNEPQSQNTTVIVIITGVQRHYGNGAPEAAGVCA